jgi:hypothetical protein
VQTLLAGGLLYLVALAIVARTKTSEQNSALDRVAVAQARLN